MIDLRYLKAFRAAAADLNFSRASKKLGISVSALSRQIALLEESAGGELFIRNTRNVVLTPLGKRLMLSANRFDQELADLRQDAPVRIGCLQSVFEFVLLEVMERNAEHFQIPLDIMIASPAALQGGLDKGDLDLILTNTQPTGAAHISGFRLYRESLCWLGDQTEVAEAGRTIVFSAFESAYPKDVLKSGNPIRINSFHGAVEMSKRKMGRVLVALPDRLVGKRARQGQQWIYVATMNYRTAPAPIQQIIKLLRRQAQA